MSKRIDLFITGYERPDLLRHQVRLITKNLADEHGLCLIDSSRRMMAKAMEQTCRDLGVIGYIRNSEPGHRHEDALNLAARHAQEIGLDYYGFLDHDIFPVQQTTLLDLISQAGFYGIAQHDPLGREYIWPGFAFFSREWVNGRDLDFAGSKGPSRELDGDVGASLAPLFSTKDWERVHKPHFGYRQIRPDDGYGTQSHSVEMIDHSWMHLTNSCHWKRVPNQHLRERLCAELLAAC